MNILYLAHRIPYPPDKGDKLRAFRQIERLARRHRIWCACFVDDPRDFRHVQKLRGYCEDVAAIELRPRMGKVRGLWSLAWGKTITEGFYQSREMAALLAKWQVAAPFDAVVAFSSSMAPYALGVPAPRRVLDLCDLDSLKWADYADHVELQRSRSLRNRALAGLYRMESSRLAAAELRWVDGFDAAVLATESETVPLRGVVGNCKLHVIGNGVELPRPNEAAITNEVAHRPVVGFVGVMDYLPNIDAVRWFATECWPVIRSRFPNASFRIVGRSPTRSVRELGRIPGIHVVGEVADVGFELTRFDISVAPLRIARGIQNKVLEAMAAAKAVVLTPKAAQGIVAANGRDYIVAEGAIAFADAVCSLLADAAARDRIGKSAREFVAKHRRWEPEMEKFEALVTEGVTRSSKFKIRSSRIEDRMNEGEITKGAAPCQSPIHHITISPHALPAPRLGGSST